MRVALLMRCRGAVHRGGAGTTYTSLAAGAPTVICSVFAERPESSLRTALAPESVARRAALGELLRGRPPAVLRAADLVESAVQDWS